MTRALFFSDVHIQRADGPRLERVLRRLRAAKGADAVYFVGDLFDFWLGYRTAIHSAYFPLMRALADLVDGGTTITILTGNHDPDLGESLARLMGVTVCDGPLSVRVGEARVWLEHGDLVDPRGWHRRAICRLARSVPARFLARQVHPDLAWRLQRIYAGADTSGDYDLPLPAWLKGAYFEDKARAGHDVVMIGHYHRAVRLDRRLDGRDHTLFALGDWVRQFTWVELADGQFKLLRDRGPDLPPLELTPGDYAPLG